jgi:hypothetical protein
MPGHAGHFISRLFSLGKDAMPLIRRDCLASYLDSGLPLQDDFDRLNFYCFNKVKKEFDTWLQFHYSEADFIQIPEFRLLNLFCGLRYSRLVMSIHPVELVKYSIPITPCEFYYVDLDLDQWGGWVESQSQKLKFVTRPNEHADFEKCKKQYHMKSISLTNMLKDEPSFIQEYLKICGQMMIAPLLEQAVWLRQDWYQERIQGQI